LKVKHSEPELMIETGF